MKTLQEIRENYAKENGFADWEQLDMLAGRQEINEHIDEICIRAQKLVLENAAENARTKTVTVQGQDEYIHDDEVVDRTSITNPENLIR